jgi:hypothetical protein
MNAFKIYILVVQRISFCDVSDTLETVFAIPVCNILTLLYINDTAETFAEFRPNLANISIFRHTLEIV